MARSANFKPRISSSIPLLGLILSLILPLSYAAVELGSWNHSAIPGIELDDQIYGLLNGNNAWTGLNTFYNLTIINYSILNVTGNVTADRFCYQNGTCVDQYLSNASSEGSSYHIARFDTPDSSILEDSTIYEDPTGEFPGVPIFSIGSHHVDTMHIASDVNIQFGSYFPKQVWINESGGVLYLSSTLGGTIIFSTDLIDMKTNVGAVQLAPIDGNVTASGNFIGNGSTLTEVCLSNGSNCNITTNNISNFIRNNTPNLYINQTTNTTALWLQTGSKNGSIYLDASGHLTLNSQSDHMYLMRGGTLVAFLTSNAIAVTTGKGFLMGTYDDTYLTFNGSHFITDLKPYSYSRGNGSWVVKATYLPGSPVYWDMKNTSWTINLNANLTKNVSITGNLVIDGNLSVKRPYMMASDNTTQTIPAANTAFPVNFSTIENSYLIDLTNKQNFTFKQTGDYLIELSAIFSTDLPNKHVEIWVQKNGVNVPRSNTKMELPTSGSEIPLAVPFIIDVNTTDVITFMMASDDAGSQMIYTTNTSYSPETPSIIVTMSKISELT